MKMTIMLLVVLGIVAGICAVMLVNVLTPILSKTEEEVTVIRAARNLSARTRLTADDLKTETVKRHEIPSDKYMTNLALSVERTLAVDLAENDFLMADHFVTSGSIAEVLSNLKPGERAVSVSLSNSQVTGGLLYRGCFVDVLASFQLRSSSRESKGEAVSTTLLERIKVLAIEGQLKDTADDEKTGPRSTRSTQTVTVTLKLDTKQAEALQVAAANGQISVSMRSPLDNLAVDRNPTVLNRGALTQQGLLIDPAVEDDDQDGSDDSSAKSSVHEVTVIRGSKRTDQQVKVGQK